MILRVVLDSFSAEFEEAKLTSGRSLLSPIVNVSVPGLPTVQFVLAASAIIIVSSYSFTASPAIVMLTSPVVDNAGIVRVLLSDGPSSTV